MSLLKVDGVTMRFGGITAVSGVTLTVEPGQIYSVIGPNGAGKTTLFNAITGIYQPTEGKVTFEGHTLEKPLTAGTLAGFAAVGLFCGLLAFLAAVGIEQLWYAAVKRPHQSPAGWSVGGAVAGARQFLAGDLVVEKAPRGSLWVVVAADGKPTGGDDSVLSRLPSQEAAGQKRDELAGGGGHRRRAEQGYEVPDSGQGRPSGSSPSPRSAGWSSGCSGRPWSGGGAAAVRTASPSAASPAPSRTSACSTT